MMSSPQLLSDLFEFETWPQAIIVQGNIQDCGELLNHKIQKWICESKSACGQCQHCQLLQYHEHPDVIEIKAPSGHPIKIEQIRELAQICQKSAHLLRFKFVLIFHAETMNLFASNALLKILEEPLAKVHFILLAKYPKLLPKTILSRCWQLKYVQPLPIHMTEIPVFELNQPRSQLLEQHEAFKIILSDLVQGRVDLMTCVLFFANYTAEDVLWYLQWASHSIIQELITQQDSSLPIELSSALPTQFWWKFWDRIEYYKKQLQTQPNLQLNLLLSELFSILLVYET